MATEQPPDGQPAAAKRAVVLEACDRIARAGGLESAHPSEQGRNQDLIDPDEQDEHASEHLVRGVCVVYGPFASRDSRSARADWVLCPSRGAADCHSRMTPARSTDPSGRLTSTTTSMSTAHSGRVARKASRINRFARLRATALPCCRDTVMPRRACSPGARGRASSRKTKCAVATRCAVAWTRRYSTLRRTR
jgi:hypothetical protein